MSVIKIDGDIGRWGAVSSQYIKEQLDAKSGDITIEINSPGGSVMEGISIFNAIRAYDKGSVEVVITGLAASMSSYIALAGDSIKAYDNAVYMIHNASIISWGDARQLRKDADHVESLTKLLIKEYIAKTSKDEKAMKKLLDDETYFYGEDILANGFCDEIIDSGKEDDPMTAKALAVESVKACISNYKANITDDENEQVAAMLNDTLRVNSASAQIENKPKGESMSKKTYTDVEVQALTDEHAEALRTSTDNAVAKERERVSGIIALGASAEFTAKAIDDGQSVGDAAIALLKLRDAQMKQNKTDFEAGAQELDGLDESEEDETLDADAKAKKEAEEALDKTFGGN